MGNRFVIADPQACIGCKTCMAACIEKHSVPGDVPVPRLNLAETLTVSAPIVCHQCEDAPCVTACPTHALYHDDANNRVAVHEDRCIGCRSCVMACPYGAIKVVEHKVPAHFGNLSLDDVTEPFAVKCDLCVDRPDGPACIQACPTKGLVLVDDETLQEGMKRKNHNAAASMASLSGTLKPIAG